MIFYYAMQHKLLLVLLLTCRIFSAHAQVLSETNLPIVLINTNGAPINDEPKIPASMKIIDNGPGQLNHPTDPANDFDGKIGIELRGSTSQGYPKKPYDLEIWDDNNEDEDASLLGMPKESDWALISPLNDKTLLRDVLAYKFAADAMDWAPRTRFCEVLLNGEYMGIYVLLETIKRDKKRVNIEKIEAEAPSTDSLTGGYVLKIDKYFNSPGGDWVSPYLPIPNGFARTYFQLHHPKRSDLNDAQFNYIKRYVTSAEKALYAWKPNSPGKPVYENWIDVDSWVNYLLVNEIAKNTDGYRLSAYLYKDKTEKDSLLHMGPVWDFNISFGIGDYCESAPYTGWTKDFNNICPQDGWVIHFWWQKLCADTLFQQRVVARWRALREGAWSKANIEHTIDSLAKVIETAQVRNFQRWQVLGQYVWPNSYIGQSWQDEMKFLRDWVRNRALWLDGNIEGVGPRPTLPQSYPYVTNARIGPNPVPSNGSLILEFTTGGQEDAHFRLYDVQGRLITAPIKLPPGPREHVEIPMNGIPPGFYFYRITVGEEVVNRGKLEVIRP